jgi:hypothetical protein
MNQVVLDAETRQAICDAAQPVAAFLVAPIFEVANDDGGVPDSMETKGLIDLTDTDGNRVVATFQLHVFKEFVKDCNTVLGLLDVEARP